MSKSKGFTLIELLVVIAIIGILAALVLVALGNARTKAQDARIKSNISQLRTLAEVYYDASDASYLGFDTCVASGVCGTTGIDSSVAALTADTQSANGASAPVANADAGGFCVQAALRSTGSYACADSTGVFSAEGTKVCDATSKACQ